MADDSAVFCLKCAMQTYAWGKVGASSEVAQLTAGADNSFEIKDDVPYAELWMGTHPNGPSMVCAQGQPQISLAEWLKRHPDSLGKEVLSYFKGSLPYLFKVLSVGTSLSIQAHPNKVHAEKLHREQPELYKDPNHKPEMAIALTPFKALCGFRPIQEVSDFIKDIGELRTVIGSPASMKLITASRSMDMPMHREAMKACFSSMMYQSKEVVTCELRKLIDRVQSQENRGEDLSKLNGKLLLTLYKDFPDDVGCFAIYFLNVVTLKPGEAMFLEADLPHAYLSGDCMECMACSDNVVRAGLTPKFLDVHTLCEMLDYTGRPAIKTKFRGIQSTENNCKITVFKPPINDFAVIEMEIGLKQDAFKLISYDSASICIVIKGEGKAMNRTIREPIPLGKGTVFFISAKEEVELCVTSNGMHLFRALAGL
ncbi:hypothetical protein ScPMuIL_018980 [Solemya velum]